MSSDTVEVNGNTHAEGGVQLPTYGAEVEDKETIAGDYVFSEQLGFAKPHKRIATAIGKIEKKPMTQERVNSINSLRGQEERLKHQQELVKFILDGRTRT